MVEKIIKVIPARTVEYPEETEVYYIASDGQAFKTEQSADRREKRLANTKQYSALRSFVTSVLNTEIYFIYISNEVDYTTVTTYTLWHYGRTASNTIEEFGTKLNRWIAYYVVYGSGDNDNEVNFIEVNGLVADLDKVVTNTANNTVSFSVQSQ